MKIFYGWKMVMAAAGLQFIQSLMLYQAFGAYAAALIEEKNWSKTSVSGASSLMSMEAVGIGAILGWFIDKYGSRQVIRIGSILFGIGLILLSQIDTLSGLYTAMVVLAIGSSMAGYFPLNVGIIQWFEKKRARALSYVTLGIALGGICVPAMAWSIQTFGWRSTALWSGVIAMIVGFPLAGVFRRRPEDFGEVVDGAPRPLPEQASVTGTSAVTGQDPSAEAVTAPSGGPSFTVREALRTHSFWLLSCGHASALIIVTAVNTHAINHMRTSLGYTIAQAAVFITLMTAFQVIGVLSGGYLGDKFEKRKVSAICMLMHAAGLMSLTYATGATALVVFSVLHGLAWGIRGPFMQAIRADYFGRAYIGMILGISGMLAAVGQIAGPLLAGVLGDATGNYRLGFTVLACIAIGGSSLFWFARKPPLPARLFRPGSVSVS
jgi:MFS family permease